MKKLYLIVTGLIISLTTMAQAGNLIWAKTFGGSGADSARSVSNTTDGGYYVAGVTYSNDGSVTGNHNPNGNFSDVWVIKVDQNGALVWQKTFGGSFQDEANSIYTTSDGGAVIAGWTNSADGDIDSLHGTAGGAADFWIIKIDNTGTLQWQATLGGTQNDYGQSVQQTSDGGYIVTGSTYSNDGDVSGLHGTAGAAADFWVVKLNSAGAVQWQQTYGGTGNDFAASIAQTADLGYIVTGVTYSLDGDVGRGNLLPATTVADYWLVKLSTTGALTWQSCFGGTYPSVATGVTLAADGGYFISGYTNTNDYNVSGNHQPAAGATADNWIVEGASTNGTLQSQNCWGGSYNDYAFDIIKTRDGHVVVTGTTNSNNGQVSGNHESSGDSTYDIWTYELNPSGYTDYWYSCFGGSGSDAAYSVTETTDSNLVEVGTTNSTDGQVTGNNGGYDFWVIKVQSEEGAPSSSSGIVNVAADDNLISIYPNPASDYTTISVSNNLVGNYMTLTDAVGRTISTQQITNSKFTVKTNGLASGIYMVKVSDNSKQEIVKKLVIQ